MMKTLDCSVRFPLERVFQYLFGEQEGMMWKELKPWQKILFIVLCALIVFGFIFSIWAGLFVENNDAPVSHFAKFIKAYGSSQVAAWMQVIGVILAIVTPLGIAYEKYQHERREKVELAKDLLMGTKEELDSYRFCLAYTLDNMKDVMQPIALPPEENRFIATNLLLFRPELPIGNIRGLLYQFNQSIRRVTDISNGYNGFLMRDRERANDTNFCVCNVTGGDGETKAPGGFQDQVSDRTDEKVSKSFGSCKTAIEQHLHKTDELIEAIKQF